MDHGHGTKAIRTCCQKQSAANLHSFGVEFVQMCAYSVKNYHLLVQVRSVEQASSYRNKQIVEVLRSS